jgi:catalase
MTFCFPPKFPTLRREKEFANWWQVWVNLPILFVGEETNFCDIIEVLKIEAPTGIEFKRTEFWHSFRITFLGFGFGYARQWGY